MSSKYKNWGNVNNSIVLSQPYSYVSNTEVVYYWKAITTAKKFYKIWNGRKNLRMYKDNQVIHYLDPGTAVSRYCPLELNDVRRALIKSENLPSIDVDWLLTAIRYSESQFNEMVYKKGIIPPYTSNPAIAKTLWDDSYKGNKRTAHEICNDYLQYRLEIKTFEVLSSYC